MKHLLALVLCASLAAQTQNVWIPGTNVGIETIGLTYANLTTINARPALVLVWYLNNTANAFTLRQSPDLPLHSITLHEVHALDRRQCVRERGQPLWLNAGGDVTATIDRLPVGSGYLAKTWPYPYRLNVRPVLTDLVWRPIYDNGWPPLPPCYHLDRPEFVAMVITWDPM